MTENLRVSFKGLIGKHVLIASNAMGDATKLHNVILRGVESGGIWIESEELTADLLKMLKINVASKTSVFFLPYHRIALAISSIDRVALSESALGL